MRRNPSNTPPCNVYCDGLLIQDVSQFDAEEGWLEHYPRNSKGQYIADPREPQRVYSIIMWGRITWEPLS